MSENLGFVQVTAKKYNKMVILTCVLIKFSPSFSDIIISVSMDCGLI